MPYACLLCSQHQKDKLVLAVAFDWCGTADILRQRFYYPMSLLAPPTYFYYYYCYYFFFSSFLQSHLYLYSYWGVSYPGIGDRNLETE